MSVVDISKMGATPVQDAEIVTERTPEIVAAEIRQIRDDTLKDYLNSCIEIGKRLCEAKEMVAHGEWAGWLKTAVSFSQRTANNLMKIYEQYGAAQGELWGASAISQTFANLTYSQAVALLAVPAEEREEFVEQNDVANMSTRELQEAIKARDEAEEKLKEERKAADDRVRAAQRQAENVMEELDKLKDEVKNSKDKKELEKLKTQLKDAKDKLKAHENLHSVQMEEVNAVQIQNQEEINRLKAELVKAEHLGAERLAADEETARFKILYQTVQNNFSDLMDAMASIRDEAAKGKRKAAVRALLDRFAEVLEE